MTIPKMRFLTKIALRGVSGQKYEYQHVETMQEAFDELARADYDVLLLDLGLPGTQGIDTLEMLRRHNDAIPVIVLSGLEDEAVAVESFGA